jgi:putative glutamine amidotransferase
MRIREAVTFDWAGLGFDMFTLECRRSDAGVPSMRERNERPSLAPDRRAGDPIASRRDGTGYRHPARRRGSVFADGPPDPGGIRERTVGELPGSRVRKPLIAITSDVDGARYVLKSNYVARVVEAGGLPVILPPVAALAPEQVERFDGFILTGGDDIDTRPFGIALHAESCVMDPRRQEGEQALLDALDARAEVPVLGICLGMQLMGFRAGAKLIQHLPESCPTGELHLSDRIHRVSGDLGSGEVMSWHHQALADPGRLTVIARAADGVIEGLKDPDRPFYIGVQWHPERTPDPALGLGVIRRLVDAARTARLGLA